LLKAVREGSRANRLLEAVIKAARAIGKTAPLLRVAGLAPAGDRPGLIDEALALARAGMDTAARVTDLLLVANCEPASRETLETEAMELLKEAAEKTPDTGYRAIVASFPRWSVVRRDNVFEILGRILPMLEATSLDDGFELWGLFETYSPPQHVGDAILEAIVRRIEIAGGEPGIGYRKLIGYSKLIAERLAPYASADRFGPLLSYVTMFKKQNRSSKIAYLFEAAGPHRIPPFLWPGALEIVAAEENELYRRNALVRFAAWLPVENIDAALEIAQSMSPGDDRLDAELALLCRMSVEERQRRASEWLATIRTGNARLFLPDEPYVALLEAIVNGEPPSPAAWRLTSPGALLCRDWLTRADGTGDKLGACPEMTSPEYRSTDLGTGSPEAEVVEDGGGKKGDDTPDPEIGEKTVWRNPEEWWGDDVSRGNDESAKKPPSLDEAEFHALISLARRARRASDAACASILGLARERAVDVPDLSLRWERLITVAEWERRITTVAEFERSSVNQDTIRFLLDTCEKLAALGDAALSAASFAELSILTGDRKHEKRAVSFANKMEVRESAYGSFSGDERDRPAVRAAILLGVAAAASLRGDSLDELLLGATRDLLFLGG
jgi:hypothetical protein